MTHREAFLAHLSGRPACGEQSLKVWRLAHRLGPAALDALVEQLVAEGRVSVETDDRGMRKVRLAGQATPRELPPVEIETAGVAAPPEAVPTLPPAENLCEGDPCAEPDCEDCEALAEEQHQAAEPADRDTTVSPEPPEAPPSFFRRCGALGASLLGQTLRCALDAGHGGAHGDGATLWWTDPAPEPSPTPPPVSGPREVEATVDDPVAAVLARVPRELRHTLARLLIDLGVALAGGSEGAAHLTARAADREGPTLSTNAAKVLAALPPAGSPSLSPQRISERSGVNYNSTITALRSLERHGLAKNPAYGCWRAA